jgi:hypothetical protein
MAYHGHNRQLIAEEWTQKRRSGYLELQFRKANSAEGMQRNRRYRTIALEVRGRTGVVWSQKSSRARNSVPTAQCGWR